MGCAKKTVKEGELTYVFGILVFLRAFDELELLAPVDKGRKSGNNKDGQVDCSAIKPSYIKDGL